MANGLIGKVTAGGGTHLIASTAYFTCATAGGTKAKIAAAADTSLDSITLMTGLTIYVKFTNANTIANPTLALYKSDGTTSLLAAKNIMRYGTTAPGTNAQQSWRAGAVVAFTYDGTNWVEHSGLDDNNTYTIPSAGTSATAVSTTASGGSATTWSKSDHVHNIVLATGDNNGQVKIAGTNVDVKGLGSLAYLNNLSASDVGITVTSSSVSDGTNTFSKYSHPTSAGNKHIPTGGSTGQLLKYGGSSGTAAWTTFTTNTPTSVTKKTVVTSATVANEILTISTGDSVTVTAGTAASFS